LVFTVKGLLVIDTSTANAGIFTGSSVYQIPYSQDGGADDESIRNKEDLRDGLRLGLSLYTRTKCLH
jgi:hypothetical protein